jgi:hypothetical protein
MPCIRPSRYLLFSLLLIICNGWNSAARASSINDSLPSKAFIFNIFPGLTIFPDSSTFILPFNRVGNLILLQARADTTEGNFILDTGCPHLVLNITYFRHYLLLEAEEERTGITASDFSVARTQVTDFSIGPMKYFRLKADLANLGNIENSKGVKILGLIGMQLLSSFEMILDYEKNLIYMHRVSRKEASTYRNEMLNDTSAYTTVPIELVDDRIMLRTELAGKKLRLIIDSGAESNMLDSRLPNKVFENIAITGRMTLSGAGAAKIDVLRGDLNVLIIGNQHFEKLPVLIANLEKTCFSYGGCVDGILGFDFLSLRKLGFNFVTNKMFIWK